MPAVKGEPRDFERQKAWLLDQLRQNGAPPLALAKLEVADSFQMDHEGPATVIKADGREVWRKAGWIHFP